MGGARKSWREKLQDSKGLPKVETITAKMSSQWGRIRNWIVADFEDRLVRPGE
jgi:hypothetical protein